MFRIVGQQTEGLAVNAHKSGDDADAELWAQLQYGIMVRKRFYHAANIINAKPVFRNRPPEQSLIRRDPFLELALAIAEIPFRPIHRFNPLLTQPIAHSLL